MNTFIITAHPSTAGFTHQIADVYSKAHIAAGNDCEILNLYSSELRQDFLSYEKLSDMSKQPHVSEIQGKINAADRLVFVFPLWWYEPPAILKNFADVNLTAGYAFKFAKTGIIGLLKPKEVQIFSTTGGPKWVYTFFILPFARSFLRLLNDSGLKKTAQVVFGSNRHKTKQEHGVWLEQVEKIAKK